MELISKSIVNKCDGLESKLIGIGFKQIDKMSFRGSRWWEKPFAGQHITATIDQIQYTAVDESYSLKISFKNTFIHLSTLLAFFCFGIIKKRLRMMNVYIFAFLFLKKI